jgi:hypothetical protein
MLSERQKKADRLARELAQCPGCWVVSPMPLADDVRALRFQLLDKNRDEVISELCQSGWIPNLVSAFPRFTGSGLVAASMFEVDIPKERPPIVADNPKIETEMAEAARHKEKAEAARYIAAFRKSAGLDK